MIISILFPVSIWGPFKATAQCSASVPCRCSNFRSAKQGGEKVLGFVFAFASPVEILGALLRAMVQCCARVVAVGAAATRLPILCVGGQGQWPQPGWWISARTRPAISCTGIRKQATCPASSHLTGLFLSGKCYELCSFFSRTSCPLERPKGCDAIWAVTGTLLCGPCPGIFRQHQALKLRIFVRCMWTKLLGSVGETPDIIWAFFYYIPKESSGNCYQKKKTGPGLCYPHLHLVTITHAAVVSSEALGLSGSMVAVSLIFYSVIYCKPVMHSDISSAVHFVEEEYESKISLWTSSTSSTGLLFSWVGFEMVPDCESAQNSPSQTPQIWFPRVFLCKSALEKSTWPDIIKV